MTRKFSSKCSSDSRAGIVCRFLSLEMCESWLQVRWLGEISCERGVKWFPLLKWQRKWRPRPLSGRSEKVSGSESTVGGCSFTVGVLAMFFNKSKYFWTLCKFMQCCLGWWVDSLYESEVVRKINEVHNRCWATGRSEVVGEKLQYRQENGTEP